MSSASESVNLFLYNTPLIQSNNSLPLFLKDPCKLYVNNLPLDATKKQIKRIFSSCGVVNYVQLFLNTSGKSKVCLFD